MSEMSNSFSPGLTRAVFGAGALIRYSFYLIGALVLGALGIGMISAHNGRTRAVDEQPSFHLASPHLEQLPPRTNIVSGNRLGRVELLQYGSFHNRDISFSIGMAFPPEDAAFRLDPAPEIRSLMPRALHTVLSSSYHDLETRFGALRAAEVRVENDGQWKQCLTFASRFETPALYLVGWYCDASGAKPNAAALACIIDRLVLDRELASSEADAFMRARAARPASCSAVPVSQTVDTRARATLSSPQRWSTPSPTYNRH